ncbi:NAD(P)-binding domain-containing protein [Hoeflea sp. G2-23]|uniref:NAD(P)-binding domain-containing protein n=1 Tax=Hoeflea algicola TaxID=2983763 RepID=A0ABT3Z546_9HYPH|nr:NAD(P)-dependent oxidoreductase [Hoeflea algicola]MCY0146893.1 NAD(P)-binding domain-containing protein [Hoeflea algicola]
MPEIIFSTHSLHPEVTAQLQTLGSLVIASEPSPAAILEQSAGASIIVVRAPIAPEIFAREKGLRAAIRHGAGLDMIPLDAATEAGVLVANVPGVNAVTVAEHCIWSSLALLRRYPEVSADLRTQGWARARAHSDHGRELSGSTIAIVGMGNVGNALFRIAHGGFSMKVLAVTSRPESLPDGAQAASLDEALANSDVVVLACPLNENTRGMIGAEQLARMRPGAILVNVARGPVVQQQALVEALQTRSIGGAVLDVFNQQPLPSDHPYIAMRNVILTPHMAGITEESMLRMGQGVVWEATRILAGKQPRNFCNPSVWNAYLSRFG